MIETELLLTFIAMAVAVILIPGPTVLLVSRYALSSGMRLALPCIVGVCLGDATAMALTFIGLGALLAASSEWFLALKWLGAAYLIWLGIELWRAPLRAANGTVAVSPMTETGALGVALRGFAVNVLHPKGLAFYAAFLPQFIDAAAPAAPQMLLLGSLFVSIAAIILLVYALAAARCRDFLVQPKARRWFNRCGATCFVGAGLFTATLNRG